MPLYAIVIAPPETIIRQVKTIQQQLHEITSATKLLTTDAHVTFNKFSGNDVTLQLWENYIDFFTQHHSPFTVCFDKICHFSNGAWVLLPDENSLQSLVALMKGFYKNAPAPYFGKSLKPHITIARKLNAAQTFKANEIVNDLTLTFSIQHLALRKFDPITAQYETFKTCYFSHKAIR